MIYVLYNPISGNGEGVLAAEKIIGEEKAIHKLVDMTAISSYTELVSALKEEDELIICGGDGTLNRFINAVDSLDLNNRIFYSPTGTGNDFYTDITGEKSGEPIEITELIKNLPTVTVNGEKYKFINGVGYGIDGYCCEVGDIVRKKGKKANYTAIAIKGLLFKFKPRNATVTIDGVKKEYKKVWIAPTMFGRHYGGGMIPTPNQDRSAEPKKLSVMVFHGSSKLKTLMIFPSIFKGEHVAHTECVTVLTGNNITVEFDSPTSLQIDGETVLGVAEYTASV